MSEYPNIQAMIEELGLGEYESNPVYQVKMVADHVNYPNSVSSLDELSDTLESIEQWIEQTYRENI